MKDKILKEIKETQKFLALGDRTLKDFLDTPISEEQTRLFEQIYNKTHQIYYTISNIRFEELNHKTLFLSKKKEFCKSFFKYKWPKETDAYLYSIRPIKKLDLFNPSSQHDRELISSFVPDYLNDYFEHMLKINELSIEKRNIRFWRFIEKFQNEIKAAGYDGFAIYCKPEYDKDPDNFYDADNIAIFDTDNVKLIDYEWIGF